MGDEQTYIDVEMQETCRAIATAFNSYNPPKRVNFLEAWVISRSGPDIPSNCQILAVEPYIDPQRYIKHNNNYGFVHPLNRCTPQAFRSGRSRNVLSEPLCYLCCSPFVFGYAFAPLFRAVRWVV